VLRFASHIGKKAASILVNRFARKDAVGITYVRR